MATNDASPLAPLERGCRDDRVRTQRLEKWDLFRRWAGHRDPRDARRAYGHSRRASTVDAGIWTQLWEI